MQCNKAETTAFLVGFGILLPVFFTLGGGIYRAEQTMFDSGGVLETLPLPISILTCVFVLAFKLRSMQQSVLGLRMIAATVCVLLVSLWFGADGTTPPGRKLLVMAQVVLPMLGLLVGQLIWNGRSGVQSAFLTVLTLIVPAQLYFTYSTRGWGDENALMYQKNLTDQMQLFTIYSHLQYVPLVFVAAYAIALSTLWERHKVWLAIMSMFMAIYAMRSFSYLSVTAFALVISVFLLTQFASTIVQYRKVVTLLLAVVICIALPFADDKNRSTEFFESSFGILAEKYSPLLKGEIPSNVEERFRDWHLFGKRILESPQTLMFGHPEPMPRQIRTSPHNWYLDIAHTFGMIGLLPILYLIAYSARLAWTLRRKIGPETWWLCGVVAFMVIIDSNFKVTLRQPYPGIFIFFLWGLLLKQLEMLRHQGAEQQ